MQVCTKLVRRHLNKQLPGASKVRLNEFSQKGVINFSVAENKLLRSAEGLTNVYGVG